MNNVLVSVTAIIISLMGNAHALENENLFIFVGEKISVQEIENKPFTTDDGSVVTSMDGKFHSKYKIKHIIQGVPLHKNEIEFFAYDHYGKPEFSKYENVLLFVILDEEQNTHVKYQFYDVYPTINGGWASCGRRNIYQIETEDKEWYLSDVNNVKVSRNISYDVKEEIEWLIDDEEYTIYDSYPKKYFEISNGIARCKGNGISVEEIARDHKKLIFKYWD